MNVDSTWKPPPDGLALATGQVHVWRVGLDVSESCLCDQCRVLAPDELSRAERFAFARDRRRFIAARATLRLILGRYLEVEPSLLRFGYGEWGKPFLSPMPKHPNLCFNLSHSDELALCAIAARRQVGIDLEQIRPVDDMDQIVQRFYSPAERRALCSLSGQARQEAFLRIWTYREAYVKATGRGLASLIDRPGPLESGAPSMLGRARWRLGSDCRWTLHELTPGPGYAAALAVEGHDCQIEFWQFAGK